MFVLILIGSFVISILLILSLNNSNKEMFVLILIGLFFIGFLSILSVGKLIEYNDGNEFMKKNNSNK
jgi:hypothetical protein